MYWTQGIHRGLERHMQHDFRTNDLRRMATDLHFDGGFSREIVAAYRRRIQSIRAAIDERPLRNVKAHRFEKLKGARAHQHSMRLNDQWRLILEFGQQEGEKVIHIVDIEDYH